MTRGTVGPRRVFCLAMWLRAVMLFGLVGCAHTTRTARAASPGEPGHTVATYSTNFGLSPQYDVLDALEAVEVDVLVLVESTPVWQDVASGRRARWVAVERLGVGRTLFARRPTWSQ